MHNLSRIRVLLRLLVFIPCSVLPVYLYCAWGGLGVCVCVCERERERVREREIQRERERERYREITYIVRGVPLVCV